MRALLLAPCLVALGACGCGSSLQEESLDPGTTSSTTTTSTDPPGSLAAAWTIRDQSPYARTGHSAVLDEAGDRMIVFGGAANDTWELPLSRPHANEWTELVVEGKHPTIHGYGSTLYTDSAVYDPLGERMIVLLNPVPTTADSASDVELWELSLSGTPAWHRLETAGPSPGAEVQSGRLVLDRSENRLIVAGGTLAEAGVWTLSLGATPSWSRLADMPDAQFGFHLDASLVLDDERHQLVHFGGHPRLGELWALSLETAQWTLLDEGNSASDSYQGTTVLDAENDRLVLLGGDQNSSVALFSLETLDWTFVELDASLSSHRGASGIVDSARDRVLYFSGQSGEQVINTTWAFALDTLSLTEMLPATQRTDLQMGQRAAVWDPVRNAVVAFGDYQGDGYTWLRGSAATDSWTTAAVGETPAVSFLPAIHDPVGQAVIAFGGYHYTESKAVVRLPSGPGAQWETVPVPDGPLERSRHVAIYDDQHQRMIIHGGWRSSSYPPAETLGDTWALTLGAAPAWAPLLPAGAAPSKRLGHAAVHDPAFQRMVIYGGADGQGAVFDDVWSLSLTDTPEWTHLSPTGKSPGSIDGPSAVYDSKGARMILVDLAAEGARVFALDLGETVAWHRFCWEGITPAATSGFPGSSPGVVLLEDGLFVTVSGGAFRFDLTTPYCE